MLPSRRSSSENSSVQVWPAVADGLAGNGVDLADGVEAILLMVLGGLETVALAGDAMHQDRTAELLGLRSARSTSAMS